MRLIDADAILCKMESVMDMQDAYLPVHFMEMVIDDMPTAEPVRHGCNITIQHPVDEFVCSECKIHLKDYVRVEDYEDSGDITHHEYEIKYCPECGAKMDLEVNDESEIL